MDNEDYLVHYGVLGMKWGVRKARKTGGSYKYTSRKTKKLTKKADKAKASGKKNAGKLAAKAKASKLSDKKRLNYAKNTSVGKAVAQNLLLGPVGALTYQKMRANGVSRGKAIAQEYLAFLTFGYAGMYGVGSKATTRSAKQKKK